LEKDEITVTLKVVLMIGFVADLCIVTVKAGKESSTKPILKTTLSVRVIS
jgi:hypothetical protein